MRLQTLKNNYPLLAAALCCFPLAFLGYGPDDTSYSIIESVRYLWAHHTYVPSRFPGYFCYEMIEAMILPWGGYSFRKFGRTAGFRETSAMRIFRNT